MASVQPEILCEFCSKHATQRVGRYGVHTCYRALCTRLAQDEEADIYLRQPGMRGQLEREHGRYSDHEDDLLRNAMRDVFAARRAAGSMSIAPR